MVFATHFENELSLTQMKVCKTTLVVRVFALPSSMVLMVLCLINLLASKFSLCWSSGGGYGCWCWLSFLDTILCICGYLLKSGISFVFQLGLFRIYVFVLGHCVGVDSELVDQNDGACGCGDDDLYQYTEYDWIIMCFAWASMFTWFIYIFFYNVYL